MNPDSSAASPALNRIAALSAAMLIAQQVAAKATRDALFLGVLDAASLPVAMIAGAGASLCAVLIFTRLTRRFGPGLVLPYGLGLSAFLYLAEWTIVAKHPVLAVWLVYLHLAIFGGVAISGFWSIFGELVDPSSAKKMIGKIGASATLGGVLGGLGAAQISASFELRSNLLFMSALHFLTAWCLLGLVRQTPASTRGIEKSSGEGFPLIFKSKYLRSLALLVCLTAAISALTDYAFKAEASSYFHDDKELLRFFASFYALSSFLTFLTQSTLARRSLNSLGLGGTLALLPGAVILFSFVGVVFARLGSWIALKGVSTVLENSMHRSGYELLYTPLSPAKKRTTKTLIDVSFDKIGGAAGALFVLAILATLPGIAPRIAVGMAGLLATVTLVTAWRLNSGYVSALVTSLKNGSLNPDKISILDATTKRTISDTTMALDRDRLLKEIEVFRGRSVSSPKAAETDQSVTSATESRHEGAALLEGTRILVEGNDADIQNFVRGTPPFAAELAPFVIRLLSKPSLRKPIEAVLIEGAPLIVGQLHDTLVNEGLPVALRRRIPQILASHLDSRCVSALQEALTLPHFDLRFRAARALVSMQRANSELVTLDRGEIHSLVLKELRREASRKAALPGTRTSKTENEEPGLSVLPSDDGASPWLGDILRRRLQHRLEHVFTLLSLVHERVALELSLTALFGEDAVLQGTALEFLENILPSELILALKPYLHLDMDSSRKGQRERKEILNELLLSTGSFSLKDFDLSAPPSTKR